jgi:hypothetical protein
MTPQNDDDIAKRAYAIWQREGQPDGRDAEHWRMAQQELASEGTGGSSSAGVGDEAPAPRRKPTPTLVRSRPRKSGT